MTEKPIMIMACGKVSGFNKIMFLMGVFQLKTHSFTTAAFKLMFQLLIFGKSRSTSVVISEFP